MTLLRLQILLALRALPEGRAQRVRTVIVALVGLILMVGALRQSYASMDAALLRVVNGPHALVALTTLMGRVSALAGSFFFIISAVLYAQIVNRPDMRIQAASPLSPRLIIAIAAFGAAVILSVSLLILAVPLIILMAGPLSLGPPGILAACLIVLTAPALPASCGLLLAIVLLRVIPAARARTLTALLGPLISVTIGLSARLIVHFSPHGPLGLVSRTLTRLWDESPLTWDGWALAAVARADAGAALARYGALCALTAAILALCAVCGRGLLAAGWAAYSGIDGGPTSTVRPWWPWARHPARVPGPCAEALVAPLPRAPSGGGAEWRALLAKEWVLARRDGFLKGKALFGVYSVAMVMTPALIGATTLNARWVRMIAHGHHVLIRLFPPMVLGGLIIYTTALISCGGLLVALVDGAWAREMGVRGILARTPLAPARILGALGFFYMLPCVALALGLMALGTVAVDLPWTIIIALVPVAASSLTILAALTLTANVAWPGRAPEADSGGSAGPVPQSWRARAAAGIADLAIACGATTVVLALLLARRHLWATLCIDSAVVVLALLVIALCRRIATRALTRHYSGA